MDDNILVIWWMMMGDGYGRLAQLIAGGCGDGSAVNGVLVGSAMTEESLLHHVLKLSYRYPNEIFVAVRRLFFLSSVFFLVLSLVRIFFFGHFTNSWSYFSIIPNENQHAPYKLSLAKRGRCCLPRWATRRGRLR